MIAHDAADSSVMAGMAGEPAPNRATSLDSACRLRSILIATDASENASGAVRVGLLVAGAARASAQVVSVVHALPTPIAPINPGLVSVPTDQVDYARRGARLGEVAAQLVRVLGRDPGCPVTVRVGNAAEEIARAAAADQADLVVVGLRRHGVLDRVFRDETALTVMRRSPVPVLAVTPLLRDLPRCVIAAVDFSRASVRAARLAAQIVAPGGRLLLVHVQPDEGAPSDETEGQRLVYAQGLSAAFTRLRRDLRGRSSLAAEPVVLRGTASAELLALAERADADLIAIGSHRRSAADRLLLGSVTAALARDASCSMLVTRAAS